MFRRVFLKMDEKKDGDGGGGGGTDATKELAALKAEKDAWLKEKADYENKLKAQTTNTPDLSQKAKDEAAAKDKTKADQKELEAAVRFDMSSKDWLKTNENLLPKSIAGIFAAAEKEKYDSPIEKTRSIKSHIVKEFFDIKANRDVLTPGLKAELEKYDELTQTAKQERVESIYTMIFEPTVELIRGARKAAQLKSGQVEHTDAMAKYRDKMIAVSRKQHLGEKQQ